MSKIGKNGKEYFRIPTDLTYKLFKLIELQPPGLTEFEVNFINDRLKALQEYGSRAVATQKQLNLLYEICSGLDIQGDANKLKPLKFKEIK